MLVKSEDTISGNKEEAECDVLSQLNLDGSKEEELGNGFDHEKECCQEED